MQEVGTRTLSACAAPMPLTKSHNPADWLAVGARMSTRSSSGKTHVKGGTQSPVRLGSYSFAQRAQAPIGLSPLATIRRPFPNGEGNGMSGDILAQRQCFLATQAEAGTI